MPILIAVAGSILTQEGTTSVVKEGRAVVTQDTLKEIGGGFTVILERRDFNQMMAMTRCLDGTMTFGVVVYIAR
jgi:hypothetical protein